MLRSTNELIGYVLEAKDGKIGKCKDFLFDEEQWTLRYMVADTGRWLPKKKVLISPVFLGEAVWRSKLFHVDMAKEQVAESPPLDSDAPVSRKYEKYWHKHYGISPYWLGDGVWGTRAFPETLSLAMRGVADFDKPGEKPDTYLRSCREVGDYHIQAKDGEIGHVDDFIMDDKSWTLYYLAVDTRNILPGKKVLISPWWVESIDWRKKTITLDLTREQVKSSPEYDPDKPVNREYEIRLYDYYGRPKYWEE